MSYDNLSRRNGLRVRIIYQTDKWTIYNMQQHYRLVIHPYVTKIINMHLVRCNVNLQTEVYIVLLANTVM